MHLHFSARFHDGMLPCMLNASFFSVIVAGFYGMWWLFFFDEVQVQEHVNVTARRASGWWRN
jgi:hypothetical protein